MGVERKRKHVCARIARNKKNAYQTTTADDQVGTRTIQHPLLHTLSAGVALFERKKLLWRDSLERALAFWKPIAAETPSTIHCSSMERSSEKAMVGKLQIVRVQVYSFLLGAPP